MITTTIDNLIKEWLKEFGYRQDMLPYIQYIWLRNYDPNKFWNELKNFLLENYEWSSQKRALILQEINYLVERIFE